MLFKSIRWFSLSLVLEVDAYQIEIPELDGLIGLNPCSALAFSLRRTPDNLPGRSTSPVLAQVEVFMK